MKVTRNQLRVLIENVIFEGNETNKKIKGFLAAPGNYNASRNAKKNISNILKDLNLSQSIRDIQTFYSGNSGESLIDYLTKDYSFTEKDVMDYFVSKDLVPLVFISVKGGESTRGHVLKTLKAKNKDYKYMVHHKFSEGIIVVAEKNKIETLALASNR
jgi:hypothetical protein